MRVTPAGSRLASVAVAGGSLWAISMLEPSTIRAQIDTSFLILGTYLWLVRCEAFLRVEHNRVLAYYGTGTRIPTTQLATA